jgi:hypothetical protein
LPASIIKRGVKVVAAIPTTLPNFEAGVFVQELYRLVWGKGCSVEQAALKARAHLWKTDRENGN